MEKSRRMNVCKFKHSSVAPAPALVLGAAVWEGGRASPTLRRRALRAVELWQAGEVSAIIGCGGEGAHPPSEAEVIRALCRERGVPEAALHAETASMSTEQNIRLALPILARLGTTEVVIVTDRFHLPRALLTARRLGLTARGAWPEAPLTPRRVKAILREIPAFLWYALRVRR